MSRPNTWMPIYVGDYLRDTGRLSTIAHGAYLLILMDYWANGAPPDDDEVLASIARVDRKTWDRDLRRLIRPFFNVVEDGNLHQKRIDVELRRAQENTDRRSRAGIKGAAARWSSHVDADGNRIAMPLPKPSQSQWPDDGPSPSPSESKKESPCSPPSEAPAPRPQKSRAKARTSISSDWEPDESGWRYAAERGVQRSELEKFRNHHIARGSIMADWSAAWRTWCANAVHFGRASGRPAPLLAASNGERFTPMSGGL